jgi:hypothetical protein
VCVESDEDVAVIEARGCWEPYSKEIADAHYRSFADERFDLLSDALWSDQHGSFPGAVGILANCETAEEYKEKRDAHHQKQVEANRKAREVEARHAAERQEMLERERELDAQGRTLKVEWVDSKTKSCYVQDKQVRQVGQVTALAENGLEYRLLRDGSPDIDAHSLKQFARKIERKGELNTTHWEMVSE